MENKEIRIQKIPLDTLIETLVTLYNQGIDYVDISGTPGTAFDSMAIVFTEEYMTEEGKKNFAGENINFSLEIEPNKLTDDDINQLI
jgi:hypothetical protein